MCWSLHAKSAYALKQKLIYTASLQRSAFSNLVTFLTPKKNLLLRNKPKYTSGFQQVSVTGDGGYSFHALPFWHNGSFPILPYISLPCHSLTSCLLLGRVPQPVIFYHHYFQKLALAFSVKCFMSRTEKFFTRYSHYWFWTLQKLSFQFNVWTE